MHIAMIALKVYIAKGINLSIIKMPFQCVHFVITKHAHVLIGFINNGVIHAMSMCMKTLRKQKLSHGTFYHVLNARKERVNGDV